MFIKYTKSILWRVAERLSYIEDAWCLKVKFQTIVTDTLHLATIYPHNRDTVFTVTYALRRKKQLSIECRAWSFVTVKRWCWRDIACQYPGLRCIDDYRYIVNKLLKVRRNVAARFKVLSVFSGSVNFCGYSVSPNCLTLLYFYSVCRVWYCKIFGLVHRPVFKNTNLRQAICETARCLCIFIYRTSAMSKTACCLIYLFVACVIYYSFVTGY